MNEKIKILLEECRKIQEEIINLKKPQRKDWNKINSYENQQFERINKISKLLQGELSEKKSFKEFEPEEFAGEDQYASVIGEIFSKKYHGNKCKVEMKTSQLRKFFDSARKIEADLFTKGEDWNGAKVDFYLLKPKLAYAKGRDLIPEQFYNIIMTCLSNIDSKEDFKRFMQFFEAIVAYHKFHGGD
ncbi:MAG: type III-A CRISPR-associated protein Csm2 [Candidatus Methanofastidiosia archaeon]